MVLIHMQKEKLKTILHTEFTRDRTLAIFVLVIAFLGFWNAFRFGSAALDYYFVRNAIELWQNDANMQTNEEYLAAKNAIIEAGSWHASHALYADLSGQLAEWGVVAGYESKDALISAKADYLRAARLRPSWPVTWASLAVVKWRLQEFDDEMLKYLNMADKLGQQKPEVHVLFSELGLALYQSNHPFYIEIREQTQDRLVRGLRNPQSRERIKQAIVQHDAKEFACIWSAQRDEYVYTHTLACEP